MWLPQPVHLQIEICQWPECPEKFQRHVLLLHLFLHLQYQVVCQMPPFVILVSCLQEEQVLQGTLLCCSWTLSRIVCCFSNRVDKCLISLDWDLISSACWRCKCDRTNTCVWWAISSSIISARRASWPWRAWASAEWCCKEALLWDRSSCKAWALWMFMPHALLHIAQCKGTRWGRTGLSLCRTHSGFIEVYTIPWYLSNSGFLLMK